MAIGGAKENKKRLGVEYLTHLVSVDFATNDTTIGLFQNLLQKN